MDKLEFELIYTSSAAERVYNTSDSNYGSIDAAGFDLSAIINEPITLMKGDQVKIGTGIKLNMGMNPDPDGEVKFAALVLPRSGLGTKNGLTLANTVGLIDQDYQGEIACTMRLNYDAPEELYVIRPGHRIAQLVIVPVLRPKFMVVKKFSSTTVRGENGHGSTGVA